MTVAPAPGHPVFPDLKPGEVKAFVVPDGQPYAGTIRIAIGRKGAKPKRLRITKTEAAALIAELIQLSTSTRKSRAGG